MPSRHWFRGAPDTPGWYFWRRSIVVNDPAKWRAIYADKDGDYWEDEMSFLTPRGGWWSLICEGEGEGE